MKNAPHKTILNLQTKEEKNLDGRTIPKKTSIIYEFMYKCTPFIIAAVLTTDLNYCETTIKHTQISVGKR